MKGAIIPLVAAAILASCAGSANQSAGSTSSSYYLTRGTTTLRVVNPTSFSYELHAAPDFHPSIPQPSGGVIDLGLVGPGTTCVYLPSRFDEYVTSVPTGVTDTLTWLPSASMSMVAMGPGGVNDGPSVVSFIPNNASAWSINLSGSGPVTATHDSPCVP